jgi:hypothetical protein
LLRIALSRILNTIGEEVDPEELPQWNVEFPNTIYDSLVWAASIQMDETVPPLTSPFSKVHPITEQFTRFLPFS